MKTDEELEQIADAIRARRLEEIQEYLSEPWPGSWTDDYKARERMSFLLTRLKSEKAGSEALRNAARLVLFSDTPPTGPLLTNLANALNEHRNHRS